MPSLGYIVRPHSNLNLPWLTLSSIRHGDCGETSLAAAAFYDLEGTLVSTNLVHTLGFYARNEPGLLRSFKKSAATLLSLPVFANRSVQQEVFNDLYFKRYKGVKEDRLRYLADDLFLSILKPAVFPEPTNC